LRKCQVAIVYTGDYVQAAIDAIAEPRRREILRLVRDEEMAAGRIAAYFDVTRQAVSQHLRVLYDAGLVSERRDGTRRIYRARPEGLSELRAFLDEFWSERLDALRREVETEHRRRTQDGDHKQ
jgi:DNA-binding transcriptional ArsR family regulator